MAFRHGGCFASGKPGAGLSPDGPVTQYADGVCTYVFVCGGKLEFVARPSVKGIDGAAAPETLSRKSEITSEGETNS